MKRKRIPRRKLAARIEAAKQLCAEIMGGPASPSSYSAARQIMDVLK